MKDYNGECLPLVEAVYSIIAIPDMRSRGSFVYSPACSEIVDVCSTLKPAWRQDGSHGFAQLGEVGRAVIGCWLLA